MFISARRILAATLFLAASGLALALAPPAEAGLHVNAITANGTSINALTGNAITANALTNNALTSNALTSNGTAPRGFGAGTAVDANGLHLVAFTLPDGRTLPAAAR